MMHILHAVLLSNSWQALEGMKNMTLDFSQLIHLVPIVRECLQKTDEGQAYTKVIHHCDCTTISRTVSTEC